MQAVAKEFVQQETRTVTRAMSRNLNLITRSVHVPHGFILSERKGFS